MHVQWPGRRGDVKIALGTLAAEPPPLEIGESDPRWPDMSNAVHWLVDDTGWDMSDPSTAIGTILQDEREAAALRGVAAAIVAVSDRQGAEASDAQWFNDSGWSELRRLAREALAVLET